MRPALVVAQIALSLRLLCGAGLLLHSLWRLPNVQLGMRTENLMAVQIQLPRARYPERARQLAFWEAVEERLGLLPGVNRFAVTHSLPPSGLAMNTIYAMIEIDGRGRGFSEDDRRRTDSVTILDEKPAAKLFPDRDAIGQRIKSGNTGWMEIIGIAANVRNAGLDRVSDPEFYTVKRHHADDGRLANTAIWAVNPAIVPAIRTRSGDWIRA